MLEIEMTSCDGSQLTLREMSNSAESKDSKESRPPEETFVSKTDTSSLEQEWVMTFDETTGRFYWYERYCIVYNTIFYHEMSSSNL